MEFFSTAISPRAIERVGQVLASGWLNEGPCVAEFEVALAARLGLVHPVALNSGTAALHLALAIAGIGPGDEVILPAQTFVATGLAVLMQRAVPVFADIDPCSGNLRPDAIERKITHRTRAILPVHWGGYPCEMDAIHAIATGHELTVIEDAAHALGATYHGQPIGAVSRFTCFSFQAIKHLTTGDGGALCCLDPDDANDVRRRRWFGIDRAASRSSPLGERVFDITTLGYKYHMNDLAAAVGLGNIEEFARNLLHRERIGAYYREELVGVPGLELLRRAPDRTHAYWLFTVLVEDRDRFVERLRGRGIPTSVVHQRIDRFTVFGGPRADLAGQAEFDRRQISLPIHAHLSFDQAAAVVAAIRSGW